MLSGHGHRFCAGRPGGHHGLRADRHGGHVPAALQQRLADLVEARVDGLRGRHAYTPSGHELPADRLDGASIDLIGEAIGKHVVGVDHGGGIPQLRQVPCGIALAPVFGAVHLGSVAHEPQGSADLLAAFPHLMDDLGTLQPFIDQLCKGAFDLFRNHPADTIRQ